MASMIDTAVRSVAQWLTARELRAPHVALLSDVRERAAAAALARHLPRALEIEASLHRSSEPGLRSAYAELAERALAELRDEVAGRAARGRITAVASALDGAWQAPELTEHLDDPTFDREKRQRLIANLDRFNILLGSYPAFQRALSPLVDEARARREREGPVRVLDLAAGHGGFALWAAAHEEDSTRPVRFTVSDIRGEYLDLGRRRAESAGLPITFVHQDALDLSNIAPGEYDIILSTQALHHFPAGLVALMFAEAHRKAGTGVLFIDGCRSAVHAAPIAAVGYLHYRDPALVHDAIVSLRRFFSPEELGLLCRLGSWHEHVRARWQSPGHCVVHAIRPRA